ncbi:MAG: CYTH domain-containing protein [Oscillospiraceae bacterium]|nr:CYTH domain-containing protein [Oscillospiraceae bacterium]
MEEIEVKIIPIVLNDILEKIENLNCELLKKENQINKIYDFQDERLRQNGGYARIRIINDLLKNEKRIYMTTKKIISKDEFKIMEENEIEISNEIEGENIFKSLGLKLFREIKKYRESYSYKNSLIEIDINDKDFFDKPYIEIESKSKEELKELVYKLGYTMKDTTTETIYELIDRFKGK